MTDHDENSKSDTARTEDELKGFPTPSGSGSEDHRSAQRRAAVEGATNRESSTSTPVGEQASPVQIGVASGVAGLVVGLVTGVLIGQMMGGEPPPEEPRAAAGPPPQASQAPTEIHDTPATSTANIEVDLGSPAATENLGDGWRAREPVDGRSVAAMIAPRATLTLPEKPSMESAQLIVVARATGVGPEDTLAVTPAVGGKVLPTWAVPPHWELLVAPIPRGTLPGDGVIVFESPQTAAGDGTAGPAFLVDWAGVRPPDAAAAVDLTSAEGRASLLEGFHLVEGAETNSPSVWSDGRRSRVGLVLNPNGGEYRLKLRGHAFHPIAPLSVEVRLNGDDVGELEVTNEPRDYPLSVPPGVLRPGANRVELLYPTSARPADTVKGSKDQRKLALNLSGLALAPTEK